MRQPHGQNFLTDINIARKIVAAAAIEPGDTVLEIGPGKGVLTNLIAPLALQFKAVEIDRALFEDLRARFEACGNTAIVLSDFLKYPFPEEKGPLKIVANLPYNLSTAIIEKILPESNWTTAVLMVQKEVGARLTARVSTKDYGYFTVVCRHYCKIEKLFSVGPGCFFPKPKVDSVVLKLTSLHPERLPEPLLELLKSAFSQRRKTALNSISSALDLPKSAVLSALNISNIEPKLRAENLDIAQFLLLYKNLFSRG